MTEADIEFNAQVSDLLDETEAFIRTVTSLKGLTREQAVALEQSMRECADAMDRLVEYVN